MKTKILTLLIAITSSTASMAYDKELEEERSNMAAAMSTIFLGGSEFTAGAYFTQKNLKTMNNLNYQHQRYEDAVNNAQEALAKNERLLTFNDKAEKVTQKAYEIEHLKKEAQLVKPEDQDILGRYYQTEITRKQYELEALIKAQAISIEEKAIAKAQLEVILKQTKNRLLGSGLYRIVKLSTGPIIIADTLGRIAYGLNDANSHGMSHALWYFVVPGSSIGALINH